MSKSAVLFAICLAVICHAPCAGQTTITVDASGYQGAISPLMFGHNISFINAGAGLWDTSNRTVKAQALAVIQDAAQEKPGTINFPGGHLADVYFWRRGVGPDALRPQSLDYYGGATSNTFGTDEVGKFAKDVSADIEVSMTANWWFFNNPDNVPEGLTLQEFAAMGRQEAANWVEYTNGVSPGLDYGTSQGWARSRFVHPNRQTEHDPPENFSADAVEWSDSWKDSENPPLQRTCWKSTEQAPHGYFAWLREYLASLDTRSDPGPYGVRYWEVGVEVPARYRGDNELEQSEANYYRDSVMDWCEALKAANSSVGLTENTGTTIQEKTVDGQTTAYQGKKLKIGAVMDDWANLYPASFGETSHNPIPDPGLGDWDTAVLNSVSYKHIDVMVSHLGVGYRDERYSDYIGAGGSIISSTFTLSGTPTYDFYVRAKGTANDQSAYPKLQVKLIPSGGSGTLLSAKEVEGYREPLDEDTFEVNYVISGKQDYTRFNDSSWGTRSDYRFSPDGPVTAGDYTLQIKNTGDSGSVIAMILATCKDRDDPVGSDVLIEKRTLDDQTKAVLAAPRILGSRITALRGHANGFGKAIELACGSYCYAWTLTADAGQPRNLKGALFAADAVKEMIANGVDAANFWHLNSSYYQIAQPRGFRYDPLRGCKYNATESPPPWNPQGSAPSCQADDPNNFFASPVGHLMKLLTHHFGDEKVTTTVDSPTFDSELYDSIAAMTGTPYISALGSRSLHSSGTYYEKLYVLVINKKTDDLTCNVAFEGVTMPTQIVPHVLKCWEQVPDLLEAQNTYESSPVRYETGSSIGFEYNADTQTVNLVDYELPAASVTVLEVTLSAPISYLYSQQNGVAVDSRGKFVSAIFDDRFYIQEPNRTSGIAVLLSGSGRSVGDLVTVTGTLTTSDGERAIYDGQTALDVSFIRVGTGPDPLGMRNEWLGGESSGENTPPVKDGFGFYNVGLLTQSWGLVLRAEDGYFYMYDGSNLWDGSPDQVYGVRVELPGHSVQETDFVRVTGISGTKLVGTNYVRVLRPRSESDVALVNFPLGPDDIDLSDEHGWNYLSLPGIPEGAGPETVFSGCDNGIALHAKLKRYDPFVPAWIYFFLCQSNIFGNCLVGEGYGLYINENDDHCYNYMRADVTGDQLISLPVGSDPKEAFCLIGNPFDADRSWSLIKVFDGSYLLTLPDAVATGVIHEIKSWNGTAWVALESFTGNMEARKAYAVFPQKNNLALIIPGS